MSAQIFTFAERPDLEQRLDEVADPWPEFIHHDQVLNARWGDLYTRWPEFQLLLVDSKTERVLGKGNTMPVEWDGQVETLTGGVVEVFEREFPNPNVLCAVVAVVDTKQQGRGLSGLIIGGMAEAAGRAGLGDYVVPGALVPVRFEDGVGRYLEPNVWMRHEPR